MTKYPTHLLKLIESLRKLPGVGNKSAERFAFQMLTWKEEHLAEMGDIIKMIPEHLHHCGECGCLIDVLYECSFCSPSRAQSRTICIIASPRDAFAIEETREYKGLYHILGGLLSPMEGVGPGRLNLDKLKHRIFAKELTEVIIALDSTVEGDATALYLRDELGCLNVQITRLAFGLPMGSALDYVDGGTLARAFSGRRTYT